MEQSIRSHHSLRLGRQMNERVLEAVLICVDDKVAEWPSVIPFGDHNPDAPLLILVKAASSSFINDGGECGTQADEESSN